MIQISSFDGKETLAKNYPPDGLEEVVTDLLGEELQSVHAVNETEEFSLRFSRKGRPLVSRQRVRSAAPVDVSHDRVVARLLPEGTPDPYLQAAGLMTADGRIKADRRRKFRQINEFIRVVTETADLGSLSQDPLLIVDFGCGNAYLTLALHYFLNQKLGLRTDLIGVDRNAELIDRDAAKSRALTGGAIEFVSSGIDEFEMPRPPDIVVALHACDTATDHALAKAVASRAKLIFVAPCCHHHLQAQMSVVQTEPAFRPTMRDGILMERLGDLVTDTFRALLLRMHGYRVDVFEFTLPEHTARNVMIRARRGRASSDPDVLAEYDALKKAFKVTPYLEGLLVDCQA